MLPGDITTKTMWYTGSIHLHGQCNYERWTACKALKRDSEVSDLWTNERTARAERRQATHMAPANTGLPETKSIGVSGLDRPVHFFVILRCFFIFACTFFTNLRFLFNSPEHFAKFCGFLEKKFCTFYKILHLLKNFPVYFLNIVFWQFVGTIMVQCCKILRFFWKICRYIFLKFCCFFKLLVHFSKFCVFWKKKSIQFLKLRFLWKICKFL